MSFEDDVKIFDAEQRHAGFKYLSSNNESNKAISKYLCRYCGVFKGSLSVFVLRLVGVFVGKL